MKINDEIFLEIQKTIFAPFPRVLIDFQGNTQADVRREGWTELIS